MVLGFGGLWVLWNGVTELHNRWLVTSLSLSASGAPLDT